METKTFRPLTPSEVQQLESSGNRAEDWSNVQVTEAFDASLVRNNVFMGRVWLGAVNQGYVHDGDLRLPEGIYSSCLADATVGDHCAVHNVHMLSGYRVGDHCLLFNIDEMTASDPASNPEYAWIEPMNECGGRRILPFPGMTIGDAYLWAKYRDHKEMVDRFEQMARNYLATPEGCYGQVGSHCVIKNTRTLHNVAVLSDAKTPTRIEDCVVLADGVVGYGCACEYGCIAMRFLLGEHVHLEFGVRLNDTVVGDNSTIARCEVGNNIIFPAHEQHHNNSFLIASLVMGQSNLAAGCTVGSNHNGRTADNEIVAGRGFWPGLCTSLKHSSAFASYTLLAKGSYPAELSITLPFALVNNNASKNRLEVMPAYWWMYNMYALNRNMTKFAKRDKRQKKAQHIVFDPLAPDTAEEIINGRMLLKSWIEQAYLQFDKDKEHLEVTAFGMEKGKRKTVVLRWKEGYEAYEDMLIYYALNVLADGKTDAAMPEPLHDAPEREREWVNLGGQLVPQSELDNLIAAVEKGTVDTWQQVHACYDQWWADYEDWRRRHAYQVLCHLSQQRNLTPELWQQYLTRYAGILHFVAEQIKVTREKDNTNPYRRMTYRNDAEMDAVLG
ncbi:MAG: DUF4954 family protein [Bacteroidales bacterium]|nr:DUF4954 family protein [Bacteroidales bacterium]